MSSIMSGGLKNVLKEAGIDIGVFKDYSSWSASTSKADLSGAAVEEILKRGYFKRILKIVLKF